MHAFGPAAPCGWFFAESLGSLEPSIRGWGCRMDRGWACRVSGSRNGTRWRLQTETAKIRPEEANNR